MSMQLGAMLGGGAKEEIEALTKFGRILGTLAALREEFIDIYETQELSQRFKNECLPIPILYALEDTDSKRIEKILSERKIGKGQSVELLSLISRSRRVKALKDEMAAMIENACKLTTNLKNATGTDLLCAVAGSMTQDL
jgi:geranylgeranyl pyrophosphate synthase